MKPKRLRRRLFSEEELELLRSACVELIEGGPLTEDRINDALKNYPNMLKKFNYGQLRTRLDYERKSKLL